MKKNTILILSISLILAILFNGVIASFETHITTINKDIYPDEYAKYNITIKNTGIKTDSFNVNSNYNWILILDETLTNIEPQKSKSTILKIKPKKTLSTGRSYFAPVKIKSLLNEETQNKNLLVYIKSYNEEYQEYIPSLNLYADYSKKIDPRDKFRLKIKIRNRNALNITDMKIKINSDIFNKEIDTYLLPLQEKTLELLFSLNPKLKPKAHKLNIDIIIKNKSYASLEEEFEIKSFSDFIIKKTKQRGFLKTIDIIDITNNGNIKETKQVCEETNLLKRIFASTNTEYTIIKKNNKKQMCFNINLEPEQKTKIIITKNYKLITLIIILIITAIILYFKFRSKIIIKKQATFTRSKDGKEGVSNIKIKLFLKNRTSKRIFDIEIKEAISKFTEFYEHQHIGTTKPSKIIKGKHRTIVKWNIDYLEPFEERIITYSLKSSLKMIGGIKLPATLLKYKDINGKHKHIKSNKFNIFFKK